MMLHHIQATDICEHCWQEFADHNYVPDSIDVYECPHQIVTDQGYGLAYDRSRPDCYSPDHDCCTPAELDYHRTEPLPGQWRSLQVHERELGYWCLLVQSSNNVQAVAATGSKSDGARIRMSNPNYRPFANAEEYKPHCRRLLRSTVIPNHYLIPTFFNNYGCARDHLTYEQLLKTFVFDDDGSPCGVPVTSPDPDQMELPFNE